MQIWRVCVDWKKQMAISMTFFRSGHRDFSIIFFFFFNADFFDIFIVEYGFYLNSRATTGRIRGQEIK